MRIISCLVYEHNPLLVILAAALCIVGSFVTVRLMQRTLHAEGSDYLHWCFLASVCAGSAIWSTHFIAMLGYNPGVPVTFDAALTIVSALIAIVGTAMGLMLARQKNRRFGALCGGGSIGLAISAMHYVGMFAYRPDGIVEWLPYYVFASIACAMALSAFAIHRILRSDGRNPPWHAIALLVAAIVILHFVGMAGFVVTPIIGYSQGADSEVFIAMAAAIAVAALLIVGTGVSAHLVEESQADAQTRLEKIAMLDAVTGLGNRHSFNIRLASECAQLSDGGRPFALLMVDLDRFKAINDTLGHPIGDLLLREVADRLTAIARKGDVVARIGGDEFAIIAYDIACAPTALALSERIVRDLSQPFTLENHVAAIGASIGVCLAPFDSSDAETLTQQVDVALYRAKNQGRGQPCLFTPSLTEEMRERCALEADLRRSWADDDFDLVFQPIYCAEDQRVSGAEALLRWDCEGRGEVPPSQFIPMAEELGLISRIGEMVLRQACDAAATWPRDLSISVNVSPLQMIDGKLTRTVVENLSRTGLSPKRLEIEITETALLADDAMVLQTLQELRALGVRISLDDFGTGYSSLSYLHRFPIDRVKIDRSFINRVEEDAGGASIVRAIGQLCHSLQLDVTAEGIETEAQRAFVVQHGCTHLQGFLFSEPLSAADAAALFASSRGTRAAA